MISRAAALLSLGILLAACGGAAPAAQPSLAPVSAGATASKPAASFSAQPATSAAANPSAARSAAPAASGLVKLVAGHSNPIAETMQLYMAKEAKIFDKNGLDVDVRLIAGGATSMAAVVSGETPFSHLGGSEALSSAVGGADIEVLAITSPTASFVLEVANDIKTPADLKGKRLGISNFGGSSDIALHVALKELGLDPDKDVNITPAGSTANRFAALQAGQLQGAMELPQDAVRLEQNGFHKLYDEAATHRPATGQGIVAQRAYVNAHRDVAQKYVDSIIQAGVYAKNHRDETISTIMQYTKTDDRAAVANAYDFYMQNTYTPTPFPKPELWADVQWVLGQKNEKIKDFDLNKLVDQSFVQSAVDRGLNK
ncbi:MAG TPA: ABC transporter substrate-binding protein [Chloroflexota bacterium]|nr:ABC transporter substrate-binding protein [Chloroflexota bacterium]